MTAITLTDLRDVLIASVGEESDLAAYGEKLRTMPFEDLGYDSLALIETSAELRRRYGVSIPEDLAAQFTTPGELLEFVNEKLAS
ncbi:acyl carrier protein [Amycolatopsis keratiniphila]|uniref:Carrier domain-containing protein n=1 Tax=Amycolatopsis keratiniphila subsp. keratiniphila TaxID=227715 RepID=A0A1W2M312_9PSEU|nr:acyl carrier protein [Amycolatopsis keratiniphila]ONF74380.1 hypothetical protein AVR91_0203580 [Amycolatopsis keratiniphila subsp. keratiniphila]